MRIPHHTITTKELYLSHPSSSFTTAVSLSTSFFVSMGDFNVCLTTRANVRMNSALPSRVYGDPAN